MEGQIRAMSRHMEGQETSDSDQHQGKLWNYFAFCTHPDVRGFEGHIHKNRFKSRVWKITCVFRDDLGNIKGTKIVLGVQRVCRGTRNAINVWSTMCGKVSCNIVQYLFIFHHFFNVTSNPSFFIIIAFIVYVLITLKSSNISYCLDLSAWG